jgi:hypothetical protein
MEYSRLLFRDAARSKILVSVASTLLLAEATLTEIEEKEPAARPSAPEFD